MAKLNKRFSETMRISIPQPAAGAKPPRRAGAKPLIKVTRAPRILKKTVSDASHYAALLDSIYDGVLITDAAGTIHDANVRAEDYLLLEKGELIGSRIADVIAGLDDSVLQTVRQNAEQRRFTLMEASCLRADSSLFPAEIAVHRTHFGPDERLCFYIRDITVRKQTEEALRWAHKRKLESLQNMAGGVAHDFNNKLTGVLGNAQLALHALPADSPVREDVRRIIVNAEEMADLSQKMLAYSGRGHFLLLPTNLSTVVREFEAHLREKLFSGVSLALELEPDLKPVAADRSEMEQLLLHLVKNANDSLADGTGEARITIRTSARFLDGDSVKPNFPEERVTPGSYVCIEVADTGHGISPETLQRMFDPFFSTRFLGRGLGLAAVLGIVQGHSGLIQAESQVGKGTRFSVFLPVLKEKVERLTPRVQAPAAAHGQGRILVTEDDESVRDLARRTLEQAGFTTMMAADGDESLRVFHQRGQDIDLVLLDLTMPGISGIEVLAALRRIRPDVKVLLSSGYDEKEVAARFGAQRPDGFIHKPYRMEELIAKINEMLSA